MTNKAFTLVELVIVVTILAVLGTIGFLSYLGYTENTRDSARLTEISGISKVIEVYEINNGSYPSNSDAFDVQYGGETIFSQGTFGSKTISETFGLISEIPVDPKTGMEYSYSLSYDKSEYEISGLLEGADYALFSTEKVSAGVVSARSLIRGNYNGQLLKKQDSGDISLYAIPSITINSNTITDLTDIATDNRFVYNTNNNLAHSFSGTTYNNYGSSGVKLVNEGYLEIYNGTMSSLNEDLELLASFESLQNAYEGTSLETDYKISRTLSYDIESEEEESLEYVRFLYNHLVGNSIDL